jgi:DUF1009 family protein
MQIGIVAGAGRLPEIISADAKERGYRIVTVALEGLASIEMERLSDIIKWVNPGQLGLMLKTFKDNGVESVLMAGKVPKSLLAKSKITPDLRAVKMLFSLQSKSDDVILKAITSEIENDGMKVIDTASFSPHLLTPEGLLTKKAPSKDEEKDIQYGWKIAKEIGRLDIGQTVVVKSRAVMAIEAIEGTDEAILRGGEWAGEGAVVIKVSKPQQDMRLDVPVVGIDTLKAMTKVGAGVLALEAYKSIIVNRKEFLDMANRAKISVMGLVQA